MRRWELVSGGSAKFWEIGRDGAAVTVRFGRLQTAGQTRTKELASAEAAEAHVAKLVAEKEKKGYVAVGSAVAHTGTRSTPAPATTLSAATRSATAPAGTQATAARATTTPTASRSTSPSTAAQSTTDPATAAPTSTRSTAAPATVAHTASRSTTPATSLSIAAQATTAPTGTRAATPGAIAPTGTQATAAPAASPAATQPTTAPTPEAPRPSLSPGKPAPALDEDTWVMPKAWLRDVVRQRGLVPAPAFSIDTDLAAEARQRAARQAATLDRVMAEPDSDPDLVQAARDHLTGVPTPVGAAAIAVMTRRDVASVHHWIADHGLPFAVDATIESIGLYTAAKWNPQKSDWGKPRLYRHAGAVHVSNGSVDAQMLTALRYALAVADDAERGAAEAVLEHKTGVDAVMARAYLMPERADWFDEACRQPNSLTHWWLLPCSASTYDQFVQAETSLTGGAFILHTAVYVLGPAVAPLLAQELDGPHQLADSRKQVLKVLAALPTDEAFTILLDRIGAKYVRPAVLSAMAAFPARAARLMAERVPGDDEVRQLLSVHLASHPHLEAPAGFVALDSALVPTAPPEALPSLLVSPPWLHRRPPVKPVVVPDVPVPAPSVRWEPGEREEWLEAAHRGTHHDWRELLKDYQAGRIDFRANDLFLMAPVDEVRHLLAGWDPNYGWPSEGSGKRLAARFGLDALPALLRIVESSTNTAVILLPFATAEVAALMADRLLRLKLTRRVALDWLARHRETAARLLLPTALGAPGAERRNAEAALRQLLALGVDVLSVAPEAAGLQALLSVDPVDVLPAKLPVIGEWADTRLLPQVLLSGRKHALSPEAARHLLMTAALSKPGEVYAGLPVARAALDRDSLAVFAWAVFLRWQEVGAPPKESWALSALGWFGDDSTVRALSPLIRAWPGESQHAKAVTGLDVLADIGTEVALSHLNSIAEKAKFKALKTRAREKVTQIAAELGLSRDQLADRLVPRLGLDDEASLLIDYGPRQFRVGFDEQLKPYVLDPDGKRRKDLPKPGTRDDQERAPQEHKRYLALKKDVRAVASDQIHRLERAMVDQRTWTAAEFHTVLGAHPLLWHIVRRLVWITDAGLSFRLAEDRTLADSGDDEITLPEGATVRVAHPVDLQAEPHWGEVFADYEILQPFPQLARPTHLLTPGEDFLTRLKKYRDQPYPVGKILGLTKKGWVRGEPQDAGVECWITRPLPTGGALVASLDPGIAVGAVDIFPEIKFTDLWYSTTGHGYWSAQKNAPSTADLDAITASEILSELESLHP